MKFRFQEVLVLDPDLSKDYLERIQNRTKEKKYCFDHAFDPECTNLVSLIFELIGLLKLCCFSIYQWKTIGGSDKM